MRLSPLTRVTPLLVVSALVFVIALTACSDSEASDSENSVTPVPTLVTIDTPDPSDLPDSSHTGDADPAVASGEAIFAANACVACHSTGENAIVGPGLAGIGERAATQVAGQTADEYLNEAIRDPGAFIVDGFANAMPANFGNLPEGDISDLIAFLKSL